MKKLLTLLLFSNLLFSLLQAQPVHQIKGTVIEKNSRQPLEFINVMVLGLNKGGVTNAEGHFTIEQVPPGIYRLQATAIGYKSVTTPEYILSTKDLNISIEMEENLTELAGVTVTASPFRRDLESPVSLRIIGLQEIEKSPGANRDISRIVQSYPGVAFSPIGYRNDLIVRGGSPSENRFYLDGVEIPNINHFSTQGASGGPVGILNADLIREVNFYTGAFPTDRGNALSSVLDFKLRDGDMEHNSLKATLGASEVSLTSNGHIGKKTSYLVSVRQSYLQFLFDMLDLPFLPTFTDAQFKLKTRFNEQNELTVLGLGGIDNMRLNTKADSEDNEYILSYLPKIKQETFTLGAVYRHYAGPHVQSVVVSHSYLNNRNTKYLFPGYRARHLPPCPGTVSQTHRDLASYGSRDQSQTVARTNLPPFLQRYRPNVPVQSETDSGLAENPESTVPQTETHPLGTGSSFLRPPACRNARPEARRIYLHR